MRFESSPDGMDLKNTENKYRAVESTDKNSVIKSAEVAKWDSAKLLQFYQFLMLFWEEGKFKVNSGTMHNVYYANDNYPEWPYKEFLHRINVWFDQSKGYNYIAFKSRMMTMSRVVNTYVKKHPTMVTEEIRDLLKDIPNYAWVLESFKITTTKIGADVVEFDKTRIDDAGFTKNDQRLVSTPEKNLLEAMMKVTDVYGMIAGSIKKEDIDKMNVKDKINALQKLSFINNTVLKFKPNGNTFQQINIFKDSREDLEKAILDFGAD